VQERFRICRNDKSAKFIVAKLSTMFRDLASFGTMLPS